MHLKFLRYQHNFFIVFDKIISTVRIHDQFCSVRRWKSFALVKGFDWTCQISGIRKKTTKYEKQYLHQTRWSVFSGQWAASAWHSDTKLTCPRCPAWLKIHTDPICGIEYFSVFSDSHHVWLLTFCILCKFRHVFLFFFLFFICTDYEVCEFSILFNESKNCKKRQLTIIYIKYAYIYIYNKVGSEYAEYNEIRTIMRKNYIYIYIYIYT
jgi:hypothetical protein